jgi:hypothetical protein
MPVWAVWHSERLWFSAGGRSRKVRNLRSNPRCAVCVHPVWAFGLVESAFASSPTRWRF